MEQASFKVLDDEGNRIDNTNDPALLQNYIKTFNSKISHLFYAIQQTQTTCLNCKTTQYNYQTY